MDLSTPVSARPYPHNLEAERALLGGLIADPDRMGEIGDLATDDFYRPDHGRLFGLLKAMGAKGDKIDLVTVPERVMAGDNAEQYGGVGYVMQLPDHAPSTANLAHYARLVREKSILRQMIEKAEGLANEAYTQPAEVDELVDKAAREMLSLGESTSSRGFRPLSVLVDDEFVRIEQVQEERGKTGTTTGFVALDERMGGFNPTDLVVLAARPGMGKTALALNFAQNAAIKDGAGVGIFSMEMSAQQLAGRLLCCRALVDNGRIKKGRLDPDDWERLLEASDELRELKIHIDDTPALSIGDVRARALRLSATVPGLKLILIDYLQLMRGDEKNAPREQQISSISRGLKALAKDLDVTVVALSQLNRAVETRADKMPKLSDLRESGAIEQDADMIMFIYRDEYYNKEASTEKGLATVEVAKHRHGEPGRVQLVFQGQFARFDNYAPEHII